jgi:hypothetical protein
MIALTFAIILSMGLFSSSVIGQTDTTKTDTAKIDTIKEKAPDFTNVDVVVETEWGTSEKTENVNVFVYLEAEHPHITMSENKHKQCELRIIKGITIKIYDRKTGKLLKSYSAVDKN